MPLKVKDFFNYLGTEETNLQTCIYNYKDEIKLFLDLDDIYQTPIAEMIVPEEKDIVACLYLFTHFHLYYSFSCILRCHLSECFNSVRKGIDACLSAYRIILEPKTKEQYLKRDRTFQYIKKTIQDENKKNGSPKYPLAIFLLKSYDICSEFGAHSDISSFFHRMESVKGPGKSTEHQLFHYFQFPRDTNMFKFYIIITIVLFYRMFLVFKLFLDANLKTHDVDWEHKTSVLGAKLEQLRKQYESI